MLHNDMNKAYATALNLERTVIRDAEKKAEEIIKNAKAAEKEAIDAATEKAKLDAMQFEQRRKSEILAKYTNTVTEHTAVCRTELIKKRGEIQNAVFDSLREKIIAFTQSDKYEEFSKNTLSELKRRRLSDNIEISVSKLPADKAAAKECFPKASVTVSDDIILGGFIVSDRESGIMYDLTLDSSFDAEKSEFPAVSGLRITD